MARGVRISGGVCVVLGLALVAFVAFASPEMVQWFAIRGTPGQSDPRWMWIAGGVLAGLGFSALVLVRALRRRRPAVSLSIVSFIAAVLAGVGLVATNTVDIGIDPGFEVYVGGRFPPSGWPITVRFVLGPALALFAGVTAVALLVALVAQFLVQQSATSRATTSLPD